MNVRVKGWHLPPRMLTAVYFLNTGLSKAFADEATAAQLHGFASGTYPFLRKLDARQFTRLLSAAETAIGVALVLPVVPAGLAGAALTAFALATLGLYLRTPACGRRALFVLQSRESPSRRTSGWLASVWP